MPWLPPRRSRGTVQDVLARRAQGGPDFDATLTQLRKLLGSGQPALAGPGELKLLPVSRLYAHVFMAM